MASAAARLVSMCSGMMLAACGSSAGAVAWGGIEPHLSVHGTLDGEDVNIELTGAAAVAAGITCQREYDASGQAADPLVPDLSTAVFVEAKIDILVTIGGEQRLIELELKQHDLQNDAVGSTIAIEPRVTGLEPSAGAMWLEFEWHSVPDDVTVFEEAAQSGTVVLRSFTGTPAEGGVVIPEGDGVIGATIDARWSPTESLEISFTAPCMTNDVNVN